MQHDKPNQNGPDVNLLDDDVPESRRQACKGHLCRRCGRPVLGRRRNGYCSDTCRLRERRQQTRLRVDELLDRLESDLHALREELVGEVKS